MSLEQPEHPDGSLDKKSFLELSSMLLQERRQSKNGVITTPMNRKDRRRSPITLLALNRMFSNRFIRAWDEYCPAVGAIDTSIPVQERMNDPFMEITLNLKGDAQEVTTATIKVVLCATNPGEDFSRISSTSEISIPVDGSEKVDTDALSDVVHKFDAALKELTNSHLTALENYASNDDTRTLWFNSDPVVSEGNSYTMFNFVANLVKFATSITAPMNGDITLIGTLYPADASMKLGLNIDFNEPGASHEKIYTMESQRFVPYKEDAIICFELEELLFKEATIDIVEATRKADPLLDLLMKIKEIAEKARAAASDPKPPQPNQE